VSSGHTKLLLSVCLPYFYVLTNPFSDIIKSNYQFIFYFLLNLICLCSMRSKWKGGYWHVLLYPCGYLNIRNRTQIMYALLRHHVEEAIFNAAFLSDSIMFGWSRGDIRTCRRPPVRLDRMLHLTLPPIWATGASIFFLAIFSILPYKHLKNRKNGKYIHIKLWFQHRWK
jgi:hypothetical protein